MQYIENDHFSSLRSAHSANPCCFVHYCGMLPRNMLEIHEKNNIWLYWTAQERERCVVGCVYSQIKGPVGIYICVYCPSNLKKKTKPQLKKNTHIMFIDQLSQF